jgi:MoaA/NifB/PqqE/SkfB family radical SAM enzyme
VDPQRAQAMMFSNGLLLNEENVRRLVAAGLYSVNVSLDDPRPEVHNSLRRAPEGFQKATAGITRALEGGLLVGISTYASPEALHEGRIEQTLELGHQLGVQEVTVFDVVPTGKLLPLQEKSLLSAEDKDRLLAMELEYNARPDYPHIITQSLVNGPHGAGCFAGFSQFYMTAYGDVDPCDFTPLTFGNIRDESLEAIWDRMLTHDAYQHRCDHCRMQDPTFRHKYIDDIPPDALLPWPACEELRDRPHGPQAVGSASTSAHAAAPDSSEDMAPTYEAREDQVPQVD